MGLLHAMLQKPHDEIAVRKVAEATRWNCCMKCCRSHTMKLLHAMLEKPHDEITIWNSAEATRWNCYMKCCRGHTMKLLYEMLQKPHDEIAVCNVAEVGSIGFYFWNVACNNFICVRMIQYFHCAYYYMQCCNVQPRFNPPQVSV